MISDADKIFDGLVLEFFEGWFRFHPTAALAAGVSGYEGGLPAADDDDIGALLSWLENSILSLEEVDYFALDQDRRLDLQLLFGACQEEYQALMEHDWRRRDPLRYLPACGVHQLVVAPQLDRSDALKRHLSSIPEYLRHARGQLASMPALVPALWLDKALQKGAIAAAYLRGLRQSRLQLQGYDALGQIHALSDQAADAVDDYLHYLEQEVAPHTQEVIGCGGLRFKQLLEQRHFLPADTENLLSITRRAHTDAVADLQSLCRDETGDENPSSWIHAISRGGWESASERLEFARTQSQAMRAFMVDKGLFDIPAGARLKWLENPGDTQPVACGTHYAAPVPGDPEMHGTVYLSGGITGSQVEVTAQGIRNGWPGRHLQAVAAAAGPVSGSLIRRVNPSTGMGVGWPLYVEQMMHDQGFSRQPELSLLRLLERVRRTRMATLDMEVHLQGMDENEARHELLALPGVTSKQVEIDLMRVSRYPADAVAAVIGWRLIDALRRRQEKNDSGFKLLDFHTQLLSHGVVPLPLLVRRVFGEQVWDEIAVEVGF